MFFIQTLTSTLAHQVCDAELPSWLRANPFKHFITAFRESHTLVFVPGTTILSRPLKNVQTTTLSSGDADIAQEGRVRACQHIYNVQVTIQSGVTAHSVLLPQRIASVVSPPPQFRPRINVKVTTCTGKHKRQHVQRTAPLPCPLKRVHVTVQSGKTASSLIPQTAIPSRPLKNVQVTT